ncbi:hypothetical protein A4H97_28440 [Niastella yeongjuensis]|uniref:RND efflux pump membrane fusion protein barrel-sandwich domain-containing protein n=1 Tax=Niastella yeongjuensis TaxID=354355 RepID=A0A1V9EUH4_9BACT|nr:efflux RND transporter periplasmic adaptor subunit [Niastella yeongjuensis]OQP49817.1 hypothetical protein A4H97_28440 [Niastella yeongjuensis]SEP40018.1 Multidrug efflux pump subunit AcrA (membrane-fusion protein) [Niastella yeongjuensis]
MNNLMPWLGYGGILLFSLCCNNTPVVFPERKDIVEAVYAAGKIIPENEYKLSSLSNGTIIKKLVKDGDTVQKGQLLYIINNEAAKEQFKAASKNFHMATENLSGQSPLLNDLKLSMQNAEVKCDNDSSIYYRYKALWSQNIGTRNNLDNAFANYQVSLNQKNMAEQKYYAAVNELEVSAGNARSQLASAGKDLQEYFIRSDRDGVVYQTFKETGETVFTNEVVALIGNAGHQLIRLSVDQEDIGSVQTGQQVLLQTDVTGNTIYEAIVSCIYPVMNEQDQTFRVDATFSNLSAPAFIHSSVEANIIIQKKNKALVLPRTALAANDSVWVQVNGDKTKKHIQTGITTLENVEIIAGLDETTPVLLTNKEEP